MQALVVVDDADEAFDRPLRVGEVIVVSEVDLALFERADEPLARGIVCRRARAAHTRTDPVRAQQLDILSRRVLDAAIGVVDQARCGWRCASAMRSATKVNSASSVIPKAQPIARRLNASKITARYTKPRRKRMYVRSATHS